MRRFFFGLVYFKLEFVLFNYILLGHCLAKPQLIPISR